MGVGVFTAQVREHVHRIDGARRGHVENPRQHSLLHPAVLDGRQDLLDRPLPAPAPGPQSGGGTQRPMIPFSCSPGHTLERIVEPRPQLAAHRRHVFPGGHQLLGAEPHGLAVMFELQVRKNEARARVRGPEIPRHVIVPEREASIEAQRGLRPLSSPPVPVPAPRTTCSTVLDLKEAIPRPGSGMNHQRVEFPDMGQPSPASRPEAARAAPAPSQECTGLEATVLDGFANRHEARGCL